MLFFYKIVIFLSISWGRKAIETNQIVYITLFGTLLSFSITPILIWIAQKTNFVDLPSKRKIHTSPTPYIGGAGVFLVLLVGYFGYHLIIEHQTLTIDGLLLIISCSIVFIVGLIDDIQELSPLKRIIFESIAALMIMPFGFLIESISIPFGVTLQLGVFAYPITLFWLLGVTNAYNMIDGIDGSLTLVGILTLVGGVIIIAVSNPSPAFLFPVLLLGALIGFIYWNWNGAKVFIGDSGALMVGFICAATAIKAGKINPGEGISIIILLGLCAMPIFDLFIAIFRRIFRGQKCFVGDRRHIHHMLVEAKGLATWQAALLLGFIQLIFSIIAVLSVFLPFWFSTLTFSSALIVLFFGVRWLGYSEFKVMLPRLMGMISFRRNLKKITSFIF